MAPDQTLWLVCFLSAMLALTHWSVWTHETYRARGGRAGPRWLRRMEQVRRDLAREWDEEA